MYKHQSNSHSGEGDLNFSYKIVKFFKTSLERQIYEAVHLKTLSKTPNFTIMNSKGEYTRCYIPRIIIEGTESNEESFGIKPDGLGHLGKEEGGLSLKRTKELNAWE